MWPIHKRCRACKIRWIHFPKARNFTPYKDLLLSTLEIVRDSEEKSLQLLPVDTPMLWLCSGAETCVSFGTKRLRDRPPKDSINSEVKLCLHDVEIISQKAFSSCRPPHHGYGCHKDSSPPGLEVSYCLTVVVKAVPGTKPQEWKGQHSTHHFLRSGKKHAQICKRSTDMVTHHTQGYQMCQFSWTCMVGRGKLIFV